jgi:hypothetical protein
MEELLRQILEELKKMNTYFEKSEARMVDGMKDADAIKKNMAEMLGKFSPDAAKMFKMP